MNLKIRETGEFYDRMLFKAVFQIHCSPLMHAIQPSDSGKRNTAKSCTECCKKNLKYAI